MATRTDRPNAGKYRNQLIVFLDDETTTRIAADAVEASAAKGAVLRRYIELGIKRHDALERAKLHDARKAATAQRRIAHATGSALDGPAD